MQKDINGNFPKHNVSTHLVLLQPPLIWDLWLHLTKNGTT
jgi:hypothetical protein